MRQAVAARDWAGIRQYVDGLPRGTNRSFLVGVVADIPGVEHPLREMVAAAPDDVLALTLLGTREVRLGWEVRTSARAKDVSREQFAGLHAHLRQAEQLLIRATALDPTHDAAWASRLTTARGSSSGRTRRGAATTGWPPTIRTTTADRPGCSSSCAPSGAEAGRRRTASPANAC